jgi:hypothetical protein
MKMRPSRDCFACCDSRHCKPLIKIANIQPHWFTCVWQVACDVAHLHARPADVLLPVGWLSVLAHQCGNEHHVARVAQRTPAAAAAAASTVISALFGTWISMTDGVYATAQ